VVATDVLEMKVLRTMKIGEDDLPEVGKTGRYLGARPSGKFRDIDVDANEMVHPGTGGLSVSPPPPENLHELVRPPEYGGIGKDPLWELETNELPPELAYRPDPKRLKEHGFIEPARAMSFEEYQGALHATRELWKRF
jgi:hypothetical protein